MKIRITLILAVFIFTPVGSSNASIFNKAWEATKSAAKSTGKAIGKVTTGTVKTVEATARAGRETFTGGSVSTELKDAEKHLKDTTKGTYDAVTGILKTTGYGVVATADGAVNVLDEGGQEIQDFLCDIVGKEPGEDCNVSGGVQINSDGDITGTDGNGHLVEKSEVVKEIDFYLDNAEWYDGTTKYVMPEELFMAAKEFKNKTIWPGEPISYEIFPPNKTGKIRNDAAGLGSYGSPRRGRNHRGVDYLSKVGSDVIAPVSGVVTRITHVYKDQAKNKHLKGIVIGNTFSSGYQTKVFYVEPNANIKKGSVVIRGHTVIGKSQSMLFIHAKAKDHIHVEIHGPNGILVPVSRVGMDKIK